MPYYIEILGKQIPIYGICFYCGIFLAALTAMGIVKKRALPAWEIVYSGIYIMIGAMIGAKLLFLIVSIEDIIRLQLPLLSVIKGGFVFYGGLLGGALGLLIYCRKFHMPLRPFLDVYAVVLPLGHAVGRVGCFFGGCCYGMAYDGPFCVIYRETAGQTPLLTPLLPIQLIEAAVLLVLFFLLLTVYYRANTVGGIALLYAAAYSVLRFVLEFFRGDQARGSVLWFSTSQWISLAIFIGTVALFMLRRKKRYSHE